MRKIQGLIAAAGAGTRAELPYPKTLFEVQGRPILARALDLLSAVDGAPTVIVSPSGADPVKECIERCGLQAHCVVQPTAQGMGDAVLRLCQSAAEPAEHVVLLWGDIPFIQDVTLASMLASHFETGSDFTFVTAMADSAYTVVRRGVDGAVVSVEETREVGVDLPVPGERDIGLFVFRREPVLQLLSEDVPGKFGARTGEHGFLYVIGHLAARGMKVTALPIALPLDLVSLNAVRDVRDYL